MSLHKSVILVVVDDSNLSRTLCEVLGAANYTPVTATSPGHAIRMLDTLDPDGIVLDPCSIAGGGVGFLGHIRVHKPILPMMVVSASNDCSTRAQNYQLGCDDFIPIPFDNQELLVRVGRMVQRVLALRSTHDETGSFSRGPFTFDRCKRIVTKNNKQLSMRRKLYDILIYLAERADSTVSRDTLLYQHWGEASIYTANSLYVHLRQLRQCIEDYPEAPGHLHTIRSRGFMFTSLPVAYPPEPSAPYD